jgi:hypothetical protein
MEETKVEAQQGPTAHETKEQTTERYKQAVAQSQQIQRLFPEWFEINDLTKKLSFGTKPNGDPIRLSWQNAKRLIDLLDEFALVAMKVDNKNNKKRKTSTPIPYYRIDFNTTEQVRVLEARKQELVMLISLSNQRIAVIEEVKIEPQSNLTIAK